MDQTQHTLPMAERAESIADEMADQERAQTATELAAETGFRVSSTLATLLWMERRGQVQRATPAANGGMTWRLAP